MRVTDEPTQGGAVVRVTTDRSKYPEVWTASHINIGRWYVDSESWATGTARHDLPDGADFYELMRRGRVELLTAGASETYEAGWGAACQAVQQAAEELGHDCPGPPSTTNLKHMMT